MNYKIILLLPACMLSSACMAQENIPKSVFNHIDTNNNSAIDFNEFRTVTINDDDNIQEIKREFKSTDSNNNKRLSFDEVKDLDDDVSLEEFNNADKNRSGELDQEEFTEGVIRHGFHDSDLNKDGSLDFPEFKTLAESKNDQGESNEN